jgi:hypothetical protein
MHNIKRKKFITVCAELSFAKVISDRMVLIFLNVCFIYYAVGLLQYSKSVWLKVGSPPVCIVSTFPNHLTLYICWESLPYTIHMLMCYYFLFSLFFYFTQRFEFYEILCYIMSECLLFRANSAIFHLYRGENKLIFNNMMMRSTLY